MKGIHATGEMHSRLVDSLYVEAMLLADEARGYFDNAGKHERDGLDALGRVSFSCESLKVTTRLMHIIAWLLTQRAVQAGEIRFADAMEAEGVPLLAICRGIQELNVALGGTLETEIQEKPGVWDHRRPDVPERDKMYAIRQTVKVKEGSCIAAALGVVCLLLPLLQTRAEARFGHSLSFRAVGALWPVAGFLLSFALIASRETVPFLYFQF